MHGMAARWLHLRWLHSQFGRLCSRKPILRYVAGTRRRACDTHASYKELVRVERPDGVPLTVHTDLDRLAAHMKELAPGDASIIDEVVNVARRFAHFDMMGTCYGRPL